MFKVTFQKLYPKKFVMLTNFFNFFAIILISLLATMLDCNISTADGTSTQCVLMSVFFKHEIKMARKKRFWILLHINF